MATKKKKTKHKSIRQVSTVEMIAGADELLRQGKYDEAINDLLAAEAQLKPSPTAGGKKISTPPHLVAARASLPAQIARAFALRSLEASTSENKLADLRTAVARAPMDVRYRLALGACQLAFGEAGQAMEEFEQVLTMSPGNSAAERGCALARLAKNQADQTIPFESVDSLSRGLQLLAHGELDQAQGMLSALPALDHNPSRLEAGRIATHLYYLGAISFNLGNHSAAFNDWRETGRLIQSHRLLAMPWIDRLRGGFHQIAESCWRENLLLAIDCWQEALRLSPEDPVAKTNFARVRHRRASEAWTRGNTHVAIELWLEAARIDPSDARTLNRLAVAYEKLEDKPRALDQWRALARLWRSEASQHKEDSAILQRLIKLEERIVNLLLETGADSSVIIEELETLLRLEPGNQAIQKQIVERMLELGKSQTALKRIEAMEREHGVSPELLTLKARANDQLKRYAPAYNNLEKALSLDPSNSATRRAMLVFLVEDASRASERNDRKRAVEIIDRALGLDPNHVPALVHRASIYFGDKDKLKAKELLDRVIGADPNSPQNHAIVGSVYLRHSMQKEAEAAFKKAIKLQPDAECYMNIGLIYLEAEENKKAIKYFDKAMPTADIEQILVIVISLVENNEPNVAERYLNQAIKADPEHPIPHLIKAVIQISNPFQMLLSRNALGDAKRELAEAERLAAAKPEYAGMLPEIRDLQAMIGNPPMEIASLLGGDLPPFFFDDDDEDDDEDEMDFPPPIYLGGRSRKRR